MNKRRIITLFLALCPVILIFSQDKLEVETESGTRQISAYHRQGTIYFSADEFALVLGIPVYRNNETTKLELKFSQSSLLLTGKNPYILITLKNEGKKILHQLPTSTYIINNNIYVPLVYSLDAFRKAHGDEINFIPPDRIIVKGKTTPVIKTTPDYPSSIDITGLIVDQKTNGALIRLKSKKRILSYNSSYKDGTLTFVFRKAGADTAALKKNFSKGLVKSVTSRNINGDTELTIKVDKDYSASEVLNADGSNDILITLHNKAFSGSISSKKDKWNFDVIVIDPGHGGKDAGAIGVNGAKEKDINLAISLKVGALLRKNMNDVKVVYTRSDDTFVELYKRGKIANDNNGKLFLSIHCNSAPKKPGNANGFEIYLLRPGRTKEAIAIAERENSVISFEDNPERYQKLTDENFILVSMAHSAYMKYSEKLSEILEKQFSAGLALPSRGIKQAGFYVLVGASMPSILIEAGFLSNKKDAAYLKSSKGQDEIAESIFQAVKKFKGYYESALN